MPNRSQTAVFTVFTMSAVLVTSLIALLGLAFVQAAPPNQDIIPTPTLHPVGEINYTLDVVGGQPETLTYPGTTQDGITVGETTAISEYPRGMVFTVNAESENGAIRKATLLVELIDGTITRFPAEWDAENATWRAHPWASGADQPAWTPFEFAWRIEDAQGTVIDTEPLATVYSDPTREWYRVETDYIVTYWFGAADVEPDAVAAQIVEAMAATEPRRIEGFGGPLSYKPRAVLYPTTETLGEFSGSGVTNATSGGWTSASLGMIIFKFAPVTSEYYARQPDCIYTTSTEDTRTDAERLNRAVYYGLTHETAHLYQYDFGLTTSSWWMEGEAQYFSYAGRPYETRMRHLATLQDMPMLTTDSLSREIPQADGCFYLNYDAGQSFVTWLIGTFGIETHTQIVELLGNGIVLEAAIEQATGQPFLDIENGWRAYVGFPVITPEDLDPALRLEAYEDSLIAVGETVTLPAVPAISMLYQDPVPNALVSGSCYANMQVEILRMGQLDGVAYFEVNCMGQIGWMTRDQLIQP